MSLPEGLKVSSDKRFEEIEIPATSAFAGEPWPLISIKELDDVRDFPAAGSTREELDILVPDSYEILNDFLLLAMIKRRISTCNIRSFIRTDLTNFRSKKLIKT